MTMARNENGLHRKEAVTISTKEMQENVILSISESASAIKRNGTKATRNNVDIWTDLLTRASVNDPLDFNVEAINRFVALSINEIEHGRLTASSSVMRQCHDLWSILRESGITGDALRTLKDRLYEEMKLLGLPVRHTEPYSDVDIFQMLLTLDSWIDEPNSAPSLNRKEHSVRKRTSSLPQLLRLRGLVALCAATGPRISALRSLRIDDLDLEEGVLRYAETKGKIFVETHSARVPQFAIERVRPWVEWLAANRPAETHIASRIRGSKPGAADETNLTRPLRLLCEHLSILEESGDDKVKERCGFHRFRSSIAVYAFEDGALPHVVASALTHRDIGQVAMTVYGRRALDRVADQGRVPLQRRVESLLVKMGGGGGPLDSLRAYFETMQALGGTGWRDHPEEVDVPGSAAHGNFVSEAALNMSSAFPTDYHAMEAGFTVEQCEKVAPTAGLEPATCGLTVHRSTN